MIKHKTKDAVAIVLVWLTAIALAFIVYLKFKLLLH